VRRMESTKSCVAVDGSSRRRRRCVWVGVKSHCTDCQLKSKVARRVPPGAQPLDRVCVAADTRGLFASSAIIMQGR
jgi:hypothetical protein